MIMLFQDLTLWGVFLWLDPAKFSLGKYNNSSRGCVLEVDLEDSKEFRELLNKYLLAAHKLEIKKEMSDHQLKEDFEDYNVSIGNVNNLVPNFFDKVCASLQKVCNFI